MFLESCVMRASFSHRHQHHQAKSTFSYEKSHTKFITFEMRFSFIMFSLKLALSKRRSRKNNLCGKVCRVKKSAAGETFVSSSCVNWWQIASDLQWNCVSNEIFLPMFAASLRIFTVAINRFSHIAKAFPPFKLSLTCTARLFLPSTAPR